ncbi:hypothetical protein [Sphingomonas sp. Leaf4]|uniref:hypothetical protein n=1 Tax=Sphingomonas sp. Leaf4 TaxID=2876553 RepID=UPI001E55478D|nr:hypothetical protein [Sphingomonas sp. Leaf4]
MQHLTSAPAADMRVVDAATGDEITHVLTLDEGAGRIRRLKVNGDSLVVERGDFVIIDEERAFRIEPRVALLPAPSEEAPAGDDAE